jgi:N-acyl-phosphatidylethanolamine-hydrolysing phospholipase D
MTPAERPPHHGPRGFRNPWPTDDAGRNFGAFLRWRWERATSGTPVLRAEPMPMAAPEPAAPRAEPGEFRLTWIGHATFLVQLGPLNVLTDPVWSERVFSPFPGVGPRRLAPPGLPLEALPPVDLVLLSHDHYDHLDAPTVRRLARLQPDAEWVAPLGYRTWLERRGLRRCRELDWWQSAGLGRAGEEARVTVLPVQHWTRRSPLDEGARLWASFAVETASGRVYFGGDSGYCPAFAEIGERTGPFDAVLLPIGAYEPRWFMRAAHMNPEEAIQAWRDLGAAGRFVPMHWGTFILTDEPVLEPPARLRAAWREAGLPEAMLSILRHGETLRWTRGARHGPP